jgi:hypothetical protein
LFIDRTSNMPKHLKILALHAIVVWTTVGLASAQIDQQLSPKDQPTLLHLIRGGGSSAGSRAITPMGYPATPSEAVQVPGGGGVAPARPAGQGFQDRVINCIQAGSGEGLGASQIGAFTQSCVNQ